MQYTITNLIRKTTKKDGTPLLTKTGKPYAMLSIKTQEHGDKWLSGFEGSVSKNWKVGDCVEFNVIPNGEYLNFEVPKVEDTLKAEIENLKARVKTLEGLVLVTPNKSQGSIVPDNTPSDLDPFDI